MMVPGPFIKSSRRKSPLFSTLLTHYCLHSSFRTSWRLWSVQLLAGPLCQWVPAWVPAIYISDIKWASYDFCDANKTTCKWSQAKAVWQSYVFSKQPWLNLECSFWCAGNLERLQSLLLLQVPAAASFFPQFSHNAGHTEHWSDEAFQNMSCLYGLDRDWCNHS